MCNQLQNTVTRSIWFSPCVCSTLLKLRNGSFYQEGKSVNCQVVLQYNFVMPVQVQLQMECFHFPFCSCVLEFVAQPTLPYSTSFVLADVYETDTDWKALFVCHMITHLDICDKCILTSASTHSFLKANFGIEHHLMKQIRQFLIAQMV